MSDFVRVVEVGPRDGLQNESALIDTQIKIDFINRLSETGLSMIEATSFVSPKAIPQLHDAQEVFEGIQKKPGVSYPVLVPNEQGLERALAVHARNIAIFAAASETFSLRNIHAGIHESIHIYAPVVKQAKAQGLWVRGYISCVLGCPYEGKIAPEKVLEVAEAMMRMGVDEISLGDTIGVGTPKSMKLLLDSASKAFHLEKIAVHCHDTYGQALANIYAALESGVRIIDSSVAGIGGCPYAKGATGNVATEDVVYLLHGEGIDTGVHLEKLAHVGNFICKALNIHNHSRTGIAMLAKR